MANRVYTSALKKRMASPAHHPVSEHFPQPRGRIDSGKTAEVLGFQEHDIPVLVSHGLLKPLANPVQNAKKYFAAVYVLALADDPEWLEEATRVVYDYWKGKNAQKQSQLPPEVS
jgi:hypothetical protein